MASLGASQRVELPIALFDREKLSEINWHVFDFDYSIIRHGLRAVDLRQPSI